MSRNPILAVWAVIGRIRLNPWIAYVALTWTLVVIRLFGLGGSGLSNNVFLDLAILALVATIFTLAYLREGRREAATLHALSGAHANNDQVLPAHELDSLIAQGTDNDALEAVEAALPTAPQDPALWCMWARCQMANEEPRLGIRGINRALEIDPNHAEALYLRAWTKRNYWDFAGARSTADEGLAFAPSHSGLRFEQRESTRMIEQWTRKKALPKQHRGAPMPSPRPRQNTATIEGQPLVHQLEAQVAPPREIAQTAKSVVTTETVEVIEQADPIETVEIIEEIQTIETFEIIEQADPIETVEVIERADPIETLEVIEQADPIETVEVIEQADPIETVEIIEQADPVETVEIIEQADPVETVEVIHEPQPVETVEVIQEAAVEDTSASFPAGDIDLDQFVVEPPKDIDLSASEPAPAHNPMGQFDFSGLDNDDLETSTAEPIPYEQPVATEVDEEPFEVTEPVNVDEPLPVEPTPEPVGASSPFANLQKFAAETSAVLNRVAASQAEEAA